MLDLEKIKERINNAYKQDWRYCTYGIESIGKREGIISNLGYTFRVLESEDIENIDPHERLIAWSFYDLVRLVHEVESQREEYRKLTGEYIKLSESHSRLSDLRNYSKELISSWFSVEAWNNRSITKMNMAANKMKDILEAKNE
jgi:hypothetical protein